MSARRILSKMNKHEVAGPIIAITEGSVMLGALFGAVYGFVCTAEFCSDREINRKSLTLTSRAECRGKAIVYSTIKGATLVPGYFLFKVLESAGIENPFDQPVKEKYENLVLHGRRRRCE